MTHCINAGCAHRATVFVEIEGRLLPYCAEHCAAALRFRDYLAWLSR